jgi:hypothetical protein
MYYFRKVSQFRRRERQRAYSHVIHELAPSRVRVDQCVPVVGVRCQNAARSVQTVSENAERPVS